MDRVLAKSRMMSFPLGQALVRRQEKERRDADFLSRITTPEAQPCAVVCQEDGSKVLLNGARDSWLHPLPPAGRDTFVTAPLSEAVYVGEDLSTPRNIFVLGAGQINADYAASREWVTPRAVFPSLSAEDQSMLGLALAMRQWGTATKFCASCAGAMGSSDLGMTRQCSACQHRIYPSIMPAMIVAVLDGKGHVIMSQRHRGMMDSQGRPMRTVLSGFVAQGESMEETVVREVQEETAAVVSQVRYVGSQPWPTPYELMTCYYAVAENSPELVVEASELVSVQWVAKEDVRRAMAGNHPDFATVPSFTAAHVLLAKWVNGEVDDFGNPVAPPASL